MLEDKVNDIKQRVAGWVLELIDLFQ